MVSLGSSSTPTIRSCNFESGVPLAGVPNSAFRNGMSRVKLNTSSSAAAKLHAIVPAIRHACGRRNAKRRRYIRAEGRRPRASFLRRQQRQRENALFRRDASVQERPTIPTLVLAQLGRIHEEAVTPGEQGVRSEAATRQPKHLLAREQQRLFGALGTKVLAELVTKIR